MSIFFKICWFILLFYLSADESTGLTLEAVLHTPTIEYLHKSLKKEKRDGLLHILCEKEKREMLLPLSCYKLSKKSPETDFWCLSLKISRLNSKDLKKILETEALSAVCRNHLEKNLQIFVYRKKDFLLPELRNHWTDESSLL